MQLLKFLGKYPYTVLLILVAAIAFFTLGSDFLFIDDTIIIVNNPQLKFSFANLAAIFTKPLGQINDAADYPLRFIYYRPALSLLYMLNNSVWGINPVGFHLNNLLLHLLTAVLIYRIGLQLFADNSGLALLAAALFSLHPVHNELVGRVAMNENLLGVFMAASFYFYLQGRSCPSLAAFSLALLTKESAVMLPFALLFFQLRQQPLRAALRQLTPYGVIVAAYLVVRSAVVGIPDPVGFSQQLLEPLLASCAALAAYLRLLVLPYPLSIYYPVWKYVSPLQADLIASLAVCLLLGYACRRLKNDALLAPLLFGTVIMLAPVVLKANELVLGFDRAFIAERQLYVPSIFYSLLIGALLFKFSAATAGRLAAAALLFIIPLFASATITTAAVWRNDNRVNDRFLDEYPDSVIAHKYRGRVLFDQGDLDGALLELNAALPSGPKVAADIPARAEGHSAGTSYNRLALMVEQLGVAAYQPVYAEIHLNIAQVYLAKKDIATATRKFKTVLVMQPHSVEAHMALADIYLKQRLFREASREYRLALKEIAAQQRP